MTATQLYSLYLYDKANGELVQVVKDVDQVLARPMAMDLHCMNDVAVKVVDQSDGCVVYTLGL